MYRLFFCIFLLQLCSIYDSVGQNPIALNAYLETYYSYDFNNPKTNEKPSFIYNHKRHNEIAINLALISASYNKDRIRAKGAFMIGNYAQYNLATEPNWAQFVYELNMGMKLSTKHDIWIDAGIFPSHIGFESAIGADCWTLTRSLLAENSPYYESGIKLTYINPNKTITASIMGLNGWQHIQRPVGTSTPALGMQLTYQPNDRVTFNYSNFIGNERSHNIKDVRIFHNFYMINALSSKIGFIAGFDIGTESNKYWLSPVLIARYKVKPTLTFAMRCEYYNDPKQTILQNGTNAPMNILGLSLNTDYKIFSNLLWRNEFKYFYSSQKLFEQKSQLTHQNPAFTSALSLKI